MKTELFFQVKQMESYILQKWYDEYNVNYHHIQSFNNFICHGIRNVIQATPIQFTTSKGVEIQIHIDNIYIPKPFVYDEFRKKVIVNPQDCRRMNLTYSSPIYISVVEFKNGKPTYYDRIILANIPIMVKSNYCTLYNESNIKNHECMKDAGGYFVINGIDRVLVSQQRNNYNSVYIFEEKHGFKAEIRSMSEDTNHSVLVQAFINQSGSMVNFNIPHLKSNISLAILSLGLNVDKITLQSKFKLFKIDQKFFGDIKYSIDYMYRELEKQGVYTTEDALAVIGSLGTKVDSKTDYIEYARQVLEIELFPHLGVFSREEKRIEMIVYMTYRLFLVQHKLLYPHDKDNLSNKRIENSGILLGELFKSLYRTCISDFEYEFDKSPNILDLFSKIDNTITKNIKYCFSTGKWGIQRNNYIRQGVSQVLNRLSYISTISHLQRVVIPIGKEGKNFKIRQIHSSFFGYICMYETPEGQSCGIVLNLTLTTRTSDGHFFTFIKSVILTNTKSICDTRKEDSIMIFLNGIIIGYTNTPEITTDEIKKLRRNKYIPYDVSIAWDFIENEIRIFCDKGRLIRPFIKQPIPTFEEFKQCNSFSEMVDRNYIEWLDANEVQTLVISMYPFEKGDYCEIHPSLLLGICAGAIPFLEHNPSPRNVYESSMMKQSIGFFATNFNFKYDAVFHTLDYPQRSLVSTQSARLIGMHEMPAGINCIVAVTTHGGWNAEDSIIINKSAIERGLFCSNTYHTYTFEDKGYKSDTCKKICIPPLCHQKPEWNYYHLDRNGIVRKGAYVKKNDVIIGQIYHSVEYIDGKKIENIHDCSELSEEEGIIDRVDIINTYNGNKIIKIIIRQVRIPEIGDKFANMAAQKGTCALILRQEDMPFTQDGMVPDILINSHALPSRMTISMLLEMILGKSCLLTGELGDATPFTDDGMNILPRIGEILLKHGFNKYGWETMYNGYTGKPLKSQIFIGNSYYQKLKHMVTDKIHARSYGNVTSLTRQPLAGRSKDGGLRLGEMERDCMLSHGSVQFLREKLFDLSDAFSVLICNDCGVISNSKDECHICKNNELVKTNIPYAAKLLFQMLNGCLIKTSFHSMNE